MEKLYFKTVFEILKTGHSFSHLVSQELKEFKIYEPQFNVLRILRGAKGTPLAVHTILERMIQQSSNVTRIVDKLAARGLVARNLCTEDRRKMDILITKDGLDLLEKLDAKVKALHAPMMQNLTEEELNSLLHLIQKLTNHQKCN